MTELDDSPSDGVCPIASPMRDIGSAIAHASEVEDAPAIEIRTYEDISFVLRSQAFALHPGSGHGFQWSTLLMRDSVVLLHGESHFERRRLLSSLFNKATLLEEYEQEYVVPALDRLHGELATRKGHAPVDLVATTRRIMVQVAARLVGLDGVDDSEQSIDRFEEQLQAVERGARAQRFGTGREAVTREGLRAQYRLAQDYFFPAWKRREGLVQGAAQGTLSGSEVPTDLISLMVRNRDHYEAFGEDAIVREATLMLIASIGSSTNAICFAVWDLFEWLKRHPEDLPNSRSPGFLRRCFAESQRLGQINPLYRTAQEDCTLPSGTQIRRGEVARINRPAGNEDLAAHGNSTSSPCEFDPHRTLQNQVPPYGLAFGGGPHTCIGKRFVFNESSKKEPDAAEELGIGLRIFLRYQDWGVRPLSEEPDFFGPLSERPTWSTLPVLLEAL